MNHVLVMSHFLRKDGIRTTGFFLLNNQNNATLLSGIPFLVFYFSLFFFPFVLSTISLFLSFSSFSPGGKSYVHKCYLFLFLALPNKSQGLQNSFTQLAFSECLVQPGSQEGQSSMISCTLLKKEINLHRAITQYRDPLANGELLGFHRPSAVILPSQDTALSRPVSSPNIHFCVKGSCSLAMADGY